MDDPESSEEESSSAPSRLGLGGGSYVIMQGPGGQRIRIPRALLMRILNGGDDDEEEE